MEEDISMLVPTDWKKKGAIIKVIGIGGGGNNAVSNMFRTGIEGVHFVACNTDAQALQLSPLDTKIQLGTQGLGAGCDPEQGKQAATESMARIEEVFNNNTKMVFLTAGMGGGTGTGATPVIAKTAKEKGILTVAIVTMPFSDEGPDFTKRAHEGVFELQQHVDSLLMINNDRLYEFHGELPLEEAFAKADEVLTTAVKGIAEIITRPGKINVDFADVRRAMGNSKVAVMGSGAASGEGRALQAAKEALSSPLLNNSDISGAKNILVNITASKDTLKMSELKIAMDHIQRCTGGTAEFVKRGVVYDNTLGDTMHITIVATGFRMQPFIEVPVIPEGRIIELDPYENGENPVDNEKRLSTPERGESVIEVASGRRVFKDDNPVSVPVMEKKPKPALITDDDSNMENLRNTPAYTRRKVIINTPENSHDMPVSKLTHTPAGRHHLIQDNAYLHQSLD
jgi:cell division protein FtsZ